MQINNLKFKRTLLKLNGILIKSPKWTLACFFVIALISLTQIVKLKSLYDLNDLVDKDFNTYSGLQLLNTEFDDKNQFQIVFVRPDWSESQLCSMRKIITEFYLSRSDIKRLSSTFGLKQFAETESSVKIQDLIRLDCDAPSKLSMKSELDLIKSSPWNKILNATQSYDIVVQMGLSDNDTAGRFGDFNPEVINDIQNYFKEQLKTEKIDAEIKLAGLVTFKYYLKKGYQVLQALNGLSLILCLFIFWFFYRSIKAGVIFLTSVSLTTMIVYGGMAAFGHSIDMLSNALPLMLTMSCLEDFIFFCHFRSHGYNFKKTLHKILLPSFLTSLTTAIGFASLGFSDLSIIRRFGLWAAAGGMVEWAIIFLVYPAALQLFPKLLSFNVINRPLPQFSFKTARFFKWVAYAAIPLSIWASTQIRINDSPDKIFPKSHPIQQFVNWFKENKGWTAEFSILADVNNKGLQSEINRVLSAHPDVVTFESPTLVEQYLVKNVSERYHDSLIRQWVSSDFSRRLISENNLSRHIVYINKTGVEEITSLNADLTRDLCKTQDLKTCITAGNAISYAEFGSRILKTLLDSLVISLVLVAFIIFIFRTTDIKTTFYLILTSIWGPLALIIIFGIFKIPIFYVTSICASLLVGLAGDNAIQFMYFSKKLTHSVNFLQEASLKISLGMILLCCIFFLAPFDPLISLGAIFILSFVLLYIGDVLILKAFIDGTNKSK